jgi:hypothetical protein
MEEGGHLLLLTEVALSFAVFIKDGVLAAGVVPGPGEVGCLSLRQGTSEWEPGGNRA